MSTEAVLQYVYAEGKPVSVIVPIDVWREEHGERTATAPAAAALPDEVLVDVVCTARVRPRAELSPDDITAVIEWTPLEAPDLRPYRPTEVCWNGRRLVLRHRLACSVSREEGLVVIEHESLGIRAYAESRESAIRDFAEEVLMLWDEYALAPDEELTPDAVGLKRRLLDLVVGEATGDER